MRKLSALFLVFLLILTGCTTIVNEDTDEYRALSYQYESYIVNDINRIDQFESFVNETTFESILSNVMIKVQISSDLNNPVETRYGSGVIFAEGVYNYILTTYDLTEVSGDYTATYQITDFQGRVTVGYLDTASEEQGLAIIRYIRNHQYQLSAIDLAEDMIMQGEPILLFGYKGGVMNAMSMGLMTEIKQDETKMQTLMYTTIPSDLYANGAAIINTNHQLVGIQMGIIDGVSYAIPISEIMVFLETHTSYHSEN